MTRRRDEAGTFELLARLPQQFVALGKAEYENAKREIAAKAKRGGIGALALIIALFFLFFAIASFVTAAIAGISEVWPVWLSALVVAAALLLLTVASIFIGVWLMKRGVPVPEQTIDRVEGDLQAMSEVRFNSSAHLPKDDEQHLPQTNGKGNWR